VNSANFQHPQEKFPGEFYAPGFCLVRPSIFGGPYVHSTTTRPFYNHMAILQPHRHSTTTCHSTVPIANSLFINFSVVNSTSIPNSSSILNLFTILNSSRSSRVKKCNGPRVMYTNWLNTAISHYIATPSRADRIDD
jgi:hypothetical protein